MLLLLDLLMHRALGWLGRGSSIRALELENAVLRHEVRLLRRQRRSLDLRRLDRAVLAAASRVILVSAGACSWCGPRPSCAGTGSWSAGSGRTGGRAGPAGPRSIPGSEP